MKTTKKSQTAPSPVHKVCQVLKAMSDVRNKRLTDIASAAGLDKATALRLLRMLLRNGFAVRDARSKEFALGPEAFVIGAAAAARYDPRPSIRPSLLRLADSFEDMVLVSIPRGVESVCVDSQPGSFPIRANYVEIGSRRPLGVGAGSLALLAGMADSEIEAVLPLVSARLERYPRLNRRTIEKHITQARQRGYAVMLDLVVPRVGGIAVAVLGLDQRPVAAISIAALSDRITSREQALAAALKREAAGCREQWNRSRILA